MAFIKQTLDAKEPEAAPEGEYDLRIVKWEEKETKKGSPMIPCTIKIMDRDVNAPLFTHWVLLIDDKVPVENHDMYKLNLQRFLSAFNVPYEDGGFDTDDLQGAEGHCFVGQQEGDDGIVRNVLRLPRLGD